MASSVGPDRSAEYQKGCIIGQGTYGSVYRGLHVPSGRQVAIKKVRLGSEAAQRDGVSVTAIREIKLLQVSERVRETPTAWEAREGAGEERRRGRAHAAG